jgi:hypothetical protein
MVSKIQRGRKYVVHPQLTTDPYHLRGVKVIALGVENDVVSVKSPSGKKAYYDKDALLTIKQYIQHQKERGNRYKQSISI